MSNHPTDSHFFYLWTDLNHKLVNDWLAFCSIPLKINLIHSVYFTPVLTWNRWITQVFRLPFPSNRAPVEHTLPIDQFEGSTVDALLDDLQESEEITLPRHREFDTLIYPWNEAELPHEDKHPPTCPEVQKVA